MTQRLSSRAIDDRAAIWAAKVDSGKLSPDEDAALASWLAEDTRHLGAYAKAMAVLAHTDPLMALAPELNLACADLAEAAGFSRRRLLAGGSVAAVGLVAAGFGLTEALDLFSGRSFSTRIGETRVVPLDDGSVLTLNTNSKVRVNFTPERRDIRLVQGEVLFDVAKNKRRPFVVDASGTQVRAVGTSFTVSMLPDRPVEVLVQEGVVEVKRPHVPLAPTVRISANGRALAPVNAPIEAEIVKSADVRRALSWRMGRLSFEATPLSEAVATFARYSDTKIEIDDREVARQTITGLFVSNDPVGFTKAVALSLNLRTEVSDNVVRLVR